MSTTTHTRPPYVPQIRLYQDWLRDKRGLSFATYHELWRWSVTDLDGFWQSIWDYFEMESPTPHTAVLAKNVMPGAVWFPGARTNYAHQVLRHVQPAHAAGFPAVISRNEKGQHRELSWPELRRQVASMALHLQAQGVQPGDRVAAYLPNIPEAMVAFLATISIGGVWSICAPDMGTNAVLDRFKQIEPKVLIAVDGVSYGGRDFDRMNVVQELKNALPSVAHVILHDNLGTADLTNCDIGASVRMSVTVARDDAAVQAFEPMWLPFDHPLWIVYSSGTTGLPKPIVHGHGGTVIVALANKIMHNDVGCSYQPNSWGERFHWYSSTGWVMWNAQVAGLLNGVTCVIYDGNPGGSKDNPDWGLLWRLASELDVTFFGAGAAFYANCQKAGVDLSHCGDLSRIRALGTTGSPLSPETQTWGTEQFRQVRAKHGDLFAGQDIWWCNISGGTDFAGAFVGGHRELVRDGETGFLFKAGDATALADEVRAEARERDRRETETAAFLEPLVAELKALYAQPIPREEKLRLREPIFERAMADYRARFPPRPDPSARRSPRRARPRAPRRAVSGLRQASAARSGSCRRSPATSCRTRAAAALRPGPAPRRG